MEKLEVIKLPFFNFRGSEIGEIGNFQSVQSAKLKT